MYAKRSIQICTNSMKIKATLLKLQFFFLHKKTSAMTCDGFDLKTIIRMHESNIMEFQDSCYNDFCLQGLIYLSEFE